MKRLIYSLILSVIMVASLSLNVLAIADPDVPPAINNVWVFENIRASGDQLIIIEQTITYASPPTTLCSEAFVTSLYNNGTLVDTASPYPFINGGYGKQVVSFYLDSGAAITSSTPYSITVAGNPALSWSGSAHTAAWSGTMAAWTASTPVSSTKESVRQRVLYLAFYLTNVWGDDDINLRKTSNSYPYLSAQGEEYFTNSIEGLRALCPGLFSSVKATYPTKKSFSQIFMKSIDASTAGTVLDISGAANALGIPNSFFSPFIFFVGAFILAYIVSLAARSSAVILPVMIVGGVSGWLIWYVPFIIAVLICVGLIFFVWWILFYNKSYI